jgi:hypothetical protein
VRRNPPALMLLLVLFVALAGWSRAAVQRDRLEGQLRHVLASSERLEREEHALARKMLAAQRLHFTPPPDPRPRLRAKDGVLVSLPAPAIGGPEASPAWEGTTEDN